MCYKKQKNHSTPILFMGFEYKKKYKILKTQKNTKNCKNPKKYLKKLKNPKKKHKTKKKPKKHGITMQPPRMTFILSGSPGNTSTNYVANALK